ncbi:MAG: 16S rRNA (uracil(1498)-N(3))-methyltransferase [Bacteroidales bacterium]|nr:16S rRNA (uracil(1498)-N(3))-methyltransferase [Bacteroidales bacterium]
MEIFYAKESDGKTVFLDQEESAHCVKVLRHRTGDEITVVDGLGTMMRCRLADDSPKGASAEIVETFHDWGGHPYSLTMAVCPTKNNDRYEWFVEKATEVGVDKIVPVIGERSERRVFKPERSRKIALSAMKQSLKARLPIVAEPVSVKDFILSPVAVQSPPVAERSRSAERSSPVAERSRSAGDIKLICYCFEGETLRRSIGDVLAEAAEGANITIMIGPEGDFSPEEARLAVENGYIPVHLGPSRLRTETAAVTAATAVYLHYLK